MKPTTYTFIKTFILLYGAALLATWGISEYNQEAFALKDTRVFLIIVLVLAWSKSKRLKK
ncbi:MAG: hypothetical protein P8H91_03730 [Flavobacteriaceae bacterium]|nr:hypothetical protein [Flavobacteriaceae bacterium]MDG2289602.1 hypothetical protein [Flavobacteriaceae bacterium]